jgi:glycosyltransferase involved in cell wall biosynthesis
MNHDARTDSALRIALVTETFAPEINGVAMTLGRLAAGLRARGHALDIIRPRQPADRNGVPDHHVLRPGLPIPRYHGLRLGLPSGGMLRRRWRDDRPDVVHIATEGPLGWSALRAAERLGIPVSSGFHTNFHTYSGHYGIGWMRRAVLGYLRNFHNRTCATLVPSTDLIDDLRAQGFLRLHLVGRGVDVCHFHPQHRDESCRRQWGAGPHDLVALHVGRLAPEKNIDLAVAAFLRLLAVRPDAHLVITGDGPERRRLERLAHARIHLLPAQNPDDIARIYASSDLFLFPSMSETYGNVVAEAMASALPVVAFDYAAPRLLIRDGDNGVLVRFGDEAAFIARTVALGVDQARMRACGLAARTTTEGVTWDDVVGRFVTILGDVASGRLHDSPAATAVPIHSRTI